LDKWASHSRMSDCAAPPFLNRPLGFAFLPVSTTRSGHAGGMKAISRRLSAATPPESRSKDAASRRDASTSLDTSSEARMLHAGIPSGCRPCAADTGGIACAQPPANRCDASGIGSLILCGLVCLRAGGDAVCK
jgi:hypothetical protein